MNTRRQIDPYVYQCGKCSLTYVPFQLYVIYFTLLLNVDGNGLGGNEALDENKTNTNKIKCIIKSHSVYFSLLFLFNIFQLYLLFFIDLTHNLNVSRYAYHLCLEYFVCVGIFVKACRMM